jgi:hypothetical protein
LKIDYYKKTSLALSKQKPNFPAGRPGNPTPVFPESDRFPLPQRIAPMRIAIHYLFSTLVLSLYGGQV